MAKARAATVMVSRAWRVLAAAAGVLGLSAGQAPAMAFFIASDTLPSANSVSLLAAGVAAAVFMWALVVVRRQGRRNADQAARIVALEGELNRAEAALNAEPHILFMWRGREDRPGHVSGDMRGMARTPEDPATLIDFAAWLDRESVSALGASLTRLKDKGTAFNISIKTAEGELLEADGRAAGGLAMLKLRPLAGERRETSELSYESRRLARQVERLSAILDAGPLPIWLRDGDGRLQWVNRAYLAALDAGDIDDVLEQGIELVDPAKLKTIKSDDETGASLARANVVIGGANRTLDIWQIPLHDGSAGYALDRSELEQARKKLDRHLRAQNSMLDRLTTAIAIFGPDRKLRFYNCAYQQLWGLEPAWLDGGPGDGEILDRLREQRSLPEQADYRKWKDEQLSVYTHMEPRENWWHLPDGRTLRVVGEQHPFGGVSYFYEDVTERIALESRYNELIGVQRETLDNLTEGVALFGSDGRLRLYNPSFARFWGLSKAFLEANPHVDEIIEASLRLLDDRSRWDELKYCVTGLSDSRRPVQGRIATRDQRVLDYAIAPLPDGNTLVAYVDMSDSAGIEKALRERNEALEAADRLKTDFLSNVSYELRTPLTNIIGFTESMTMGLAGRLSDKQREYLQHIETSSADLQVIIDAILDLSTIDAGAMELALQTIDVHALLGDIAEREAERIAARDLTLSVELAEDAREMIGDERRVRQVVSHLLANAIGFSPPGARVRMGGRRDGDMIALWVADTGRGMDPDFAKLAFERFRAKPAPGGHRGPGLGLAVVKGFVELHGGSVSLVSYVNKGTTVVCKFPVAGPVAAPEGAGERSGTKNGEEPAGRGESVRP